ncbi:MAG: type II secretion system GspH family protein [Rickettsiales bacterium]|nr:type II secretion system GspH family protein [Rickettsiales bacterium]
MGAVHSKIHRISGFSLVELSIALVIISVILASVLPFITESTKIADSDQTVERMEAIEEALLAFYGTNGRLPCPGDSTLSVNTANYGVEADVPGTCTGGAIEATYENIGAGVVAGMVPVKTLNLPDEYSFDGWGRRFTYHATTAATNATTAGVITIQDHALANRTTAAIYALVSHGPTGHGGHTVGASRFDFDVSTAKELENCDCDDDAVDTGYDAVLVKGMEYPTGSVTTLFDDVVIYMTQEQMLQRNYVNIGDLTTCPAGFTLIGTAGTATAFCIQTNEAGTTDFIDSLDQCAGTVTTRGNASLCTIAQWYSACQAGTINDATDDEEWVLSIDSSGGTDRAVLFGDGACGTMDRDTIGNNNVYRCCVD